MNIEQIAQKVREEMADVILPQVVGAYEEVFLRRCLEKLAEQDVEPFGHYENGRFSVSSKGGPDKWRERKEYAGATYTETQYVGLLTQLAASQAREQQLRKALFSLIVEGKSNSFEAQEALALPQETAALEGLIAKACEVMRERCASRPGVQHVIGADYIRNLPNVTLEDLK